MKKLAILIFFLLIIQVFSVSALTASDAKADWQEAKQNSKQLQEQHRNAKVDFAADRSEGNRQKVVDTGKDVLNAALDEAEAWLVWKDIEADENADIPDDLKDTIKEDIEANKDKIDALRNDVEGITNQAQLGLTFLKMIGKYTELLADVARDSGKIWVHIGNTRLDTVEEYESKLREAAETMDNKEEILEALDQAKEDLEEARDNVANAESAYEEVVVPGTPLIKFAEGNNYLRTARTNLLAAHSNLNTAFRLMQRGE